MCDVVFHVSVVTVQLDEYFENRIGMQASTPVLSGSPEPVI